MRKPLAKKSSARKPPFALEGVDHVLLLVSGMGKALRFYQDVLGCRVENRLPEYGMAQLRAGNALIDLVDVAAKEGKWARPPAANGRNMDHLCLALARYDERALRRHLAAHKIKIVEEGFHGGTRGESLSIYVRDPSGNQIELKGLPG